MNKSRKKCDLCSVVVMEVGARWSSGLSGCLDARSDKVMIRQGVTEPSGRFLDRVRWRLARVQESGVQVQEALLIAGVELAETSRPLRAALGQVLLEYVAAKGSCGGACTGQLLLTCASDRFVCEGFTLAEGLTPLLSGQAKELKLLFSPQLDTGMVVSSPELARISA